MTTPEHDAVTACRRCSAAIALVPPLGSEGAQWYQSGLPKNANGFDCQGEGRPHEPAVMAGRREP